MQIEQIWNAGRVRRWHMNPDLSGTDDFNDGHSARVARLLLAIWPDTSDRLLRAALMHDDEEFFVGDIAYPAKKKYPRSVGELEVLGQFEVADMWGDTHVSEMGLSTLDKRRLKFADYLDAFMWVRHHKPQLLERNDWREQRQMLIREASELMIAWVFSQVFWGFE